MFAWSSQVGSTCRERHRRFGQRNCETFSRNSATVMVRLCAILRSWAILPTLRFGRGIFHDLRDFDASSKSQPLGRTQVEGTPSGVPRYDLHARSVPLSLLPR